MIDTSDKNVSFRSQLTGELTDFLRAEALGSTEIITTVVDLVANISHYKEEGVVLSPDIYVCEDITSIEPLLSGSEIIRVGQGKFDEHIANNILKTCAPLAQDGWSIFVEKKSEDCFYGMFAASNTPLALTPDEVLVGGKQDSISVVMISKVAENCVEVRGARGGRRCIHFSAAREDGPAPNEAVEKLSEAITLNVIKEYQRETSRFLNKTLASILQNSHGALVVVLSKRRRKFPKCFADAINLPEPVLLAKRVSEFLAVNDNEGMVRLQRIGGILGGMINSDGIVVFRSDGIILGYRAFMKDSSRETNLHKDSGGARRRTYEALKKLVDNQEIIGAFFRSSDGHAEYYGSLNNE